MEKLQTILDGMDADQSKPGARYVDHKFHPKHLHHLRVRRATFEDLPKIDELATSDHFEIGIHNLELYFRQSPDSWHVIVDEKNELIAYDIFNDVGHGIFYGFQFQVRDDHRGMGVTKLFNTFNTFRNADGKPEPNFPLVGSATHFSLQRYHFDYFTWRILGYWGPVKAKIGEPPERCDHYRFEFLSEVSFASLCAYDRKITRWMDREKFLREWTLGEYGKTMIAIDARNEVVGYGTLRLFTDFYSISPCYADTPQIGATLLQRLASLLDENETLYVPMLAGNRTSHAFVEKFKFLLVNTEVHCFRMPAALYEKYFKDNIDVEKVFAIHEYWPI